MIRTQPIEECFSWEYLSRFHQVRIGSSPLLSSFDPSRQVLNSGPGHQPCRIVFDLTGYKSSVWRVGGKMLP